MVEVETPRFPDRILVAPRVSLSTESAPSGKRCILCLFLRNRQSRSVSRTCRSHTNDSVSSTRRAYSSAFFRERAGSILRAGRKRLDLACVCRALRFLDVDLSILREQQQNGAIVLELWYYQMAEGRVPATEVYNFTPGVARNSVSRQNARGQRSRRPGAIVYARHRWFRSSRKTRGFYVQRDVSLRPGPLNARAPFLRRRVTALAKETARPVLVGRSSRLCVAVSGPRR